MAPPKNTPDPDPVEEVADMIHAAHFVTLMRAAVQAHAPEQAEHLDAYVRECEHQDGYGYWRQFATVEDALRDFLLYRSFCD